jgi:2-amino-4-hydroxy-6-hydroxymethyldihydropteridine diphosphokinase
MAAPARGHQLAVITATVTKITTSSSPGVNPSIDGFVPRSEAERVSRMLVPRMALTAVIGLGSNLGDRAATLCSAVSALAQLGELRRVSELYETAPVGGPAQGDFLNAAVLIETELTPRELLHRLHDIERRFGRERDVRWGPRTLDLDVLWFPDAYVDEALVVPHARLIERAFALLPLLDVAPEAVDPNSGERYAVVAERQKRLDVRRMAWPKQRVLPKE